MTFIAMAESLPTYYDVLQVERDAAPERVRTAYRRLAQKYHPDKMPGNANAVRAMAAINAAYEVLSDAHRRTEHDLWIRRAERTNAPAPIPPAPASLWAYMHPATHWAWYLLCGTLLFVLSTVATAAYLSVKPARASIAHAQPCEITAPATTGHCSSR